MEFERCFSRLHVNICVDCKNACGNCEWTRWDDETGHVAFDPVPGWTAVKVPYCGGHHGHSGTSYDFTYHITACPKFERG